MSELSISDEGTTMLLYGGWVCVSVEVCCCSEEEGGLEEGLGWSKGGFERLCVRGGGKGSGDGDDEVEGMVMSKLMEAVSVKSVLSNEVCESGGVVSLVGSGRGGGWLVRGGEFLGVEVVSRSVLMGEEV